MPEENSLDKALKEIQNLLELIEKNKGRLAGPLPESVQYQLELLGRQVDEFARKSEEELRELGMPEEALRMAVEEGETEAGTPDEREALKRAFNLKQKIIEMQEELGESTEKKPVKKPGGSKKFLKGKRRRKFREMGDQDWKPL